MPDYPITLCFVRSTLPLDDADSASAFRIIVIKTQVKDTGKMFVDAKNKRTLHTAIGKIGTSFVQEFAQRKAICLEADLDATVAAVVRECRLQVELNLSRQLRLQKFYANTPAIDIRVDE